MRLFLDMMGIQKPAFYFSPASASGFLEMTIHFEKEGFGWMIPHLGQGPKDYPTTA